MQRIHRNAARFGLLILLAAVGAFAQENESARVDILLKSTTSWDGGRLPAYPDGQPEVTIAKITIPPGTALPFHQHPVINAGCLLKGTLTVETDSGKTIHLKAGDPLVEVVGRWHRGKNEGTEPAEILVVYAGVVGTPITIRKTAGSETTTK